MNDSNAVGSSSKGVAAGMVTSGIIAMLIAIVVVYLLSFGLPFPWTMGQTLVSVAIASFCGSAVSFIQGRKSVGGSA